MRQVQAGTMWKLTSAVISRKEAIFSRKIGAFPIASVCRQYDGCPTMPSDKTIKSRYDAVIIGAGRQWRP